MNRPALLIMAALLAAAAAQATPALSAPPAPPRSDLDKVQGTWISVYMERNGQPVPRQRYQGGKLVMEGDTFTYSMGGKVVSRGTRKFDPTHSPKAVDDTHTEGAFKGKSYRGIYELTDDTFKTCNGTFGAERPTSFATAPGTGLLLVVYKRERPQTAKGDAK